MGKDPVCGMEVDENRTEYTTLFQGKKYYFCSDHCREAFDRDPQAYLEKNQEPVRQERKVVIIGTGSVGATFAYALMRSGLASTIVLVGRSPDKVRAQVMDLNHGLMFVPPVHILEGTYEDCRGADLVVVTAGVAQKEGETRIDLARRNTDLFRDIIPRIARRDPGNILIVTNPVDVLTYAAIKISGMPMNRIIGSGTVLDTARFRFLLSRHCGVDPRNVHGYILGEHGDTEVPAWSKVDVGGMSIQKFCPACGIECPADEMQNIFEQVRNAAYEIIRGKGSTNFAIGLAMVRIAEAILRNENSILTISALVDGLYGIRDVCLSMPAVLNRNGVTKIIELELEKDEETKLKASADVLKKVIKDVGL
ncbi:MAG: L-lactate dehydrogenase [Desulfovibrionales bacterium]